MDQLSKVANSTLRQLVRENKCFPVPVRASEFDLARQVRPFRHAWAYSFSTARLKLVLTHEIPPNFRGDVHYIRHRASPEFFGSSICVPLAFTAESLPTKGQ